MRVLPQPATPPVPPPGLLAMLKAQVRADGSADDALLYGYALAALGLIEQLLSRMLTRRDAVATFYGWPCGGDIVLLAPIVAVTSIETITPGGSTVAFSGFIARTSPGHVTRVRLASGQSWPVLAADTEIRLTVQAGWAELPEPLLQAVLMLAAHFYANRETVQLGDRAAGIEVPFGVSALLRPYRWRWIG